MVKGRLSIHKKTIHSHFEQHFNPTYYETILTLCSSLLVDDFTPYFFLIFFNTEHHEN